MESVDEVANAQPAWRVLLTKYGATGALRILWSDVVFDWRHGVDTFRPAAIEAIAPAERHALHNRYVPSPFSTVHAALERVAHRIDPSRDTLVDIGSGKGKVMIAARRWGFDRAAGIEYDAALHAIAERNVQRLGLAGSIDCIHGDASAHAFTSDQRVLYFFNPFVGELLDACLDRVVACSRDVERLLLYVNPVDEARFDARFDCLEKVRLQPGDVRANLYVTRTAATP